MTDVTQAAAPLNVFQQIEATLSADWTKAVAVVDEAEAFAASFLTKVAAGAEIFITDIESAAGYVAGNLTSITSVISAAGSVAAAVAPNDDTVTKALADLQTTANDVAALHGALTSGSASTDPAIVTKAVTAINTVNQLAQLAKSVSTSLGTMAGASATATQAVTQSSGTAAS